MNWALNYYHRQKASLLCLLLFAAAVWVFWPSLQCGFLFYDESPEIIGNAHVNEGVSWTNLAWALGSLGYANWHPLTWLSKMLDCEIYGLRPWGHHLTNILLHAANTALVFLVLRRMTGATWRSFIAAALFGLHPLRVQSVTWISERKDVLSLLFWLLTIGAYVRYVEKSRIQNRVARFAYGLVLLCFTLGLMSKAMVVTLPFVLLLLDYWPLGRVSGARCEGSGARGEGVEVGTMRSSLGRLIVEKTPLFLLAIAVSVIALKAQQSAGMTQHMGSLSIGDRAGNALISYCRYMGKLFWPADLCVYYPHPGHWPAERVLFAGLFLLGVSLLALFGRRRRPYLFAGWFWYLGTLVPVIGLVQLLSQSMADRYTYVPMLGVVLTLVWGLEDLTRRWRHRPVMLSALAVTAMAACVVRTRAEIPFWKDDVTLYRRAVAATKDENNWAVHYGLGTVLLHTPHADEAFGEFAEAVRLKPDFMPAQLDFGVGLLTRHRFDEAMAHFQIVLKHSPTSASAWFVSGLAACNQGRLDEAIDRCRKAVEYDPKRANYRLVLNGMLCYRAEGMESNTALREALKRDPGRFDLLMNLAWLLATHPDARIRNGKEAVALAKRACGLTQYQIARCVCTLAAAYAEAGQFENAIKTAQEARSLAAAAGEQDLATKIEQLLVFYREHLPCYEPPPNPLVEFVTNSVP